MTTAVVTFRFAVDELEELRRAGLNPAELAQQQLKNVLRGLRVERGMKRAQEIVRDMGGLPFDPVQAAREARDELDRRH
jgi:hypothetical protein